MLEFLALALLCIAVPVLALLVVVRLDAPDEGRGQSAGEVVGLTGSAFVDDLLSRLRYWPAVGVCVLSFLMFATLATHSPGIPMLLALAFVLLMFARAWRYEFIGLMNRPDDSFPGRFDKPIWAALMVFLPPLGYTCLRAYRRATHSAAEQEARANAKPVASPVHDWV